MIKTPDEIIKYKLDHPITEKQQKALNDRLIRRQPARTHKVIQISGHDLMGHLIHKTREIETANLTVITDDLETSFITSDFFDDIELHKGIFTRQLGCLLKMMYSKFPHSEVKEIWDAVGQLVEDEAMRGKSNILPLKEMD